MAERQIWHRKSRLVLSARFDAPVLLLNRSQKFNPRKTQQKRLQECNYSEEEEEEEESFNWEWMKRRLILHIFYAYLIQDRL